MNLDHYCPSECTCKWRSFLERHHFMTSGEACSNLILAFEEFCLRGLTSGDIKRIRDEERFNKQNTLTNHPGEPGDCIILVDGLYEITLGTTHEPNTLETARREFVKFVKETRSLPGRIFMEVNLTDEKIGEEGASGVPYKGKVLSPPQGMQSVVAVKLMHRGLDSRARLEAAHWTLLKHPHILEFLGVGKTTETPARFGLLSPVIEGGTFQQYIHQKHKEEKTGFDKAMMLRVREIVSAVDYLHNVVKPHIVHSDIKPSNILICNRGGGALLCDFGFALATASTWKSKTDGGRNHGSSPAYTAPENLTSDYRLKGTLTTESDVFALGVTIYESLSGKEPDSDPRKWVSSIVKGSKDGRPKFPNKPTKPKDFADFDVAWEAFAACCQKASNVRKISTVVSLFRPHKLHKGYKLYKSPDINPSTSGIRIRAKKYPKLNYKNSYPLAVVCGESIPAEEILHFFTEGGEISYADSEIRIIQTSPSTVIFYNTDKARSDAVKKYNTKPLRPLENHPLEVHLHSIQLDEAQNETASTITYRPQLRPYKGYDPYKPYNFAGRTDQSLKAPISGLSRSKFMESSYLKYQNSFPLAVVYQKSLTAEEILYFFTDGGAVDYPESGIRIIQTSPSPVIFYDTEKARDEAVRKYHMKPLRQLEKPPMTVHLQRIRLDEAQIASTCAITGTVYKDHDSINIVLKTLRKDFGQVQPALPLPKETDSTLYVKFDSLDHALSAVHRSLPLPLGEGGFIQVKLGNESVKLKATFDDRYAERVRFK